MCSDAKTRKKKQEYGAIEERNASKLRTPPTPTLPTLPTLLPALSALPRLTPPSSTLTSFASLASLTSSASLHASPPVHQGTKCKKTLKFPLGFREKKNNSCSRFRYLGLHFWKKIQVLIFPLTLTFALGPNHDTEEIKWFPISG